MYGYEDCFAHCKMFFFSAFIAGQDNKSSQAERIVLDTPEVIAVKLAPIMKRVSADAHKPLGGPITADSKIKCAIVATNTSFVPLRVRSWDLYDQNRPRLLRDNQEVPYRNGLTDLLKKNESGGDIISLYVITLEPNHEKTLEYLDLSNWYEPLQPGHYQLSTQRRFIQGGKWVDSAWLCLKSSRVALLRLGRRM
jgi:hypothetical protein